jgi:S1-C subfamily serine protease
VVAVNARQGLPASGIHWHQGIVVTADHAIKRDEEITVTLPDGRTVASTLVGRDSSTDLAVLKLQGVELPVAEVGDTSLLKVGHLVLAIGRSNERGLSASLGIISALSGAWRTWYGGQIDQLVRPDLTLYPGYSGGPLVNVQGQVVGINTSGPRRMVLTIPTATVNRVIDQLLETGHVARGYLGLGMQPVRLPKTFIDTLKSNNSGLIVVTVEPEGPAEQAGVLIGDVLVALDGMPVSDTGDVQVVLTPDRIGKPVSAQVIRGGVLTELAIMVGERLSGEEYYGESYEPGCNKGTGKSRRGFRGRR